MKAFADDKLNIARMMISLFDSEENTVGKGENAGCQHFLLFPQFFLKPSSLRSLKVGIVWQRVKTYLEIFKIERNILKKRKKKIGIDVK